MDSASRRGPTGRLVRRLRLLQREQGLSQSDMAQRLGMSRSAVCMVYRGWRRPGPRFLRGVLGSFPELRDEVRRFLLPVPEDGGGEEHDGA